MTNGFKFERLAYNNSYLTHTWSLKFKPSRDYWNLRPIINVQHDTYPNSDGYFYIFSQSGSKKPKNVPINNHFNVNTLASKHKCISTITKHKYLLQFLHSKVSPNISFSLIHHFLWQGFFWKIRKNSKLFEMKKKWAKNFLKLVRKIYHNQDPPTWKLENITVNFLYYRLKKSFFVFSRISFSLVNIFWELSKYPIWFLQNLKSEKFRQR